MADISCRDRDSIADSEAHGVALECLTAGIEAAHPDSLVAEHVSVGAGTLAIEGIDGDEHGPGGRVGERTEYDLESYDDVVLVGAGNAAGHFAAALEGEFGDRLDDGAVVTDDPVATSVVETLEGDHPIPSEPGVESARAILEHVRDADEDDLLVAAITGGGSALLAAPAEPLTIADLQAVTEELLACGASIDEINAVRKHCSAIKGGRLAHAAAPATVVTLLVSDVVGDDRSVIASGPTIPDSSTYADALAVIDRYDLDVPDAVRAYLRAGDEGEHPETPTADDPAFDRVQGHVLGNGRTALEAAADAAADRGYEPLVLASGVRGEARDAALTHVAIAEESRSHATPVEPPAVLLSGGETTVSLDENHGRGGPNQEFVLAGAIGLDGEDGDGRIVVSAVDTDGVDGPTGAAGAIADATAIPESTGRDALERHDAYPVLEEANALVRTGPTGTNVNDLRAIVVDSDGN